ncbi:MAG: methylmalonyl Co-A mutase-associated GTPase MeaB [Bacteroidales bacterium]|nr:MAG: methylmalonyl Co-A mutase-associated GTPase MeaB [Bacteroidales bacterium]
MKKKGQHKSTLTINDGIPQPPSINKDAVKRLRKKKKKIFTVDELVSGVLDGNRTILSQAITLIESKLPEHYIIAQEIIEKCIPHSGNSIRVGITGVPGAGKSTFIEALGLLLVKSNHKLAILAIDPSSERTKGSILGDKTRMESLSGNPNTFIRPSPSAGTLGGVARKTREAIVLCEAAGYDTIFIETVGVGQSETTVNSMVDFFLLLMLAGAGDELQGIKRGIMEMAHMVVITKADGNNIRNAERAKKDYENALHLYPPLPSGWLPKVMSCSSIKNEGLDIIWGTILDYKQFTTDNSYFKRQRREQDRYWLYETINQNIKDKFYNNINIKDLIDEYEKKVMDGKMSSFNAAKLILGKYFKNKS